MLSFEVHTKLALEWLGQSYKATNGKGFAAYYKKRPWLKGKWAEPYPETTGYIIETLLDYYAIRQEEELREMARQSALWITSLQLESGALPSGLGSTQSQSVFNTGQMIFGLIRAFEEEQDQVFLDSASKACKWLMNILEADGSWKQGAYVPGYIPSYYTRVIWAVLFANRHLKSDLMTTKMELALNFYLKRQNEEYAFKDWAFKANTPAYTHTIAYTLRGLLESALLLHDELAVNKALQAGDKLLELLSKHGHLAGSYDENWQGDYSFQCLTGNAQLSIFFCRLLRFIGKPNFKAAAKKVFDPVVQSQNQSSNPGIRGGIPGSEPFDQGYQPYRYLNWAVKFYLDAYLHLKNIS